MPISNFRDFGGYASRHGGRVVRDRLYRSALIADASPEARRTLETYDFELIVDLRYKAEQEHQPSGWPESYASRILFHGSNRETEPPHLAILRTKVTDPAVVDRYMIDYYRDLPFNKLYRPLFAETLRRLQSLDGRLLVHCTAGKDRTGMIVVLIHSILGVSEADVMEDFLLSARVPSLEAQVEAFIPTVSADYGYAVPRKVLMRLMQVQEEYLAAAFDTIGHGAGAMDAYLDGMGIDAAVRDRLRARLIVQDG